jgi:hypothetical protein
MGTLDSVDLIKENRGFRLIGLWLAEKGKAHYTFARRAAGPWRFSPLLRITVNFRT